MEEKNETGQTGNDSGNAQNSSDSAAPAGNGMADKLIEDVKKFNMMSLVGLGLTIAFILFMFIGGLKYKWWLMLPIAGAALFILYRQLSDTQGFEKKACYYAMIALGVLVLLRDIQISNVAEGIRGYAAQVSQATNQLKNLKIKIPTQK